MAVSFLGLSLLNPISQVWASELNGNETATSDSTAIVDSALLESTKTDTQKSETATADVTSEQNSETGITAKTETSEVILQEEAPVQSIEEAAEENSGSLYGRKGRGPKCCCSS